MTTDAMTRGDRNELLKIARQRERVARSEVDQRAAELRADVEAQLSATFSAEDEAWAEVMAEVSQHIGEVNAHIDRACEARGIDEDFRPHLSARWVERGANSFGPRRAELRMAARARIEAEAKAAKHEITAASAKVQTELMAAGLTSDAAQRFLSAMPTAEALMPKFDASELKPANLRSIS